MIAWSFGISTPCHSDRERSGQGGICCSPNLKQIPHRLKPIRNDKIKNSRVAQPTIHFLLSRLANRIGKMGHVRRHYFSHQFNRLEKNLPLRGLDKNQQPKNRGLCFPLASRIMGTSSARAECSTLS